MAGCRVFLCIMFCLVAGFAAPAASMTVSVSDVAPAQGVPFIVSASTSGPVDNLAVVWKGVSWPMRNTAPGQYEALVGIDLAASPGSESLVVEQMTEGVCLRRNETIRVVEKVFPVQRLSLPKTMVEFDKATLSRIEKERLALTERFSRVTLPVLWLFPFLPPVDGYRPENFGVRREINGEKKSPHTGVDIRLPAGTPVRSIADGVVALAEEQFFGGRTVTIDHGGGVFSVYMHLQSYCVKEGLRVSRGETIGAVGATGRATGPHLHFGVRVPGGRVDPSLLFALPGK
ncbi:MAG: M23 family metallopeptidase [Syntrophorhabdaceae bacterium]|nr:M23 family metallopeptidase [Syntrophorhabdaceae bacterium]